jgi:hypothetical protein
MSPSARDTKRTNAILDMLRDVTHQLHMAERDVRTSLPLVATQLRDVRALVTQVTRALLEGAAALVDDEPPEEEG